MKHLEDEFEFVSFGMALMEELQNNASEKLHEAEKAGDHQSISYYQGVKDGIRMLGAGLEVVDHRGSGALSKGRNHRPDGWKDVVLFNPRAIKSEYYKRQDEIRGSWEAGQKAMKKMEANNEHEQS